MVNSFLKNFGWFILLAAMQVLVFGHVHLFGYATPMVYIYLIVLQPKGTPRYAPVLWGFALGLVVDIFANTPGVAAGSMALAGLVQPALLAAFISEKDADEEDFQPAFSTLGVTKYICYVACLVLLQETFFFALDFFNFFQWQDLLISIGSSTLLTVCVVLAIEGVRKRKKTEDG